MLNCLLLSCAEKSGQQQLENQIVHSLYWFVDNEVTPSLADCAGAALHAYEKNHYSDSFAVKLLRVERLAMDLNEDSRLMNVYAIDTFFLHQFAGQLVSYFRLQQGNSAELFYAAALHNLAIMYSSTETSFNKAKMVFSEAFELRAKLLGPGNIDYEETHFYIMMINSPAYHDYATIVAQLIKILACTKAKMGEANRLYASQLQIIGQLYVQLGNYDKAKEIYQEVLPLWQQIYGGKNAAYALRLCNLAILHDELSDYKKAEQLFREALYITEREKGRENLQFTWCLNWIGEMYQRIGEYERALQCFDTAYTLQVKLKGEYYNANPLLLFNMARVYQTMGMYEKALPLYQSAVQTEAQNTGKHCMGYSFHLKNLGLIYMQLSQFEKAKAIFTESNGIIKKIAGEYHRDFCFNLNYLAMIYEKSGNTDSAIILFKKSLDILSIVLTDLHRDYTSTVNSYADVLLQAGRFDSAETMLRQLTEKRKILLGEKHPEYAAVLNSLGNLYMHTGKTDSAEKYYYEALQIRKKALGDLHPLYAETLSDIGLLYLKNKQNEPASAFLLKANKVKLEYLRKTNSTLSEEEKITRMNEQSAWFSHLPSLLYNNTGRQAEIAKEVYSNELLIKGMILEDQQKIISSVKQAGDKHLSELYNEWRMNKKILGIQTLLPAAERISTFDSIQHAVNMEEQQLSLLSADFRLQKLNAYITTKDIAAKLKAGEAAIEFIRFRLYRNKWTDSFIYAALLIQPGKSTPHFIPLCEENVLRGLIHKRQAELYRNASAFKKDNPDQNEVLYAIIWKPVEKYLKRVNTVYYAPAGLINNISFQSLQDINGNYLIQQYTFNRVFSTRNLAAVREDTLVKHAYASVWGNINYDKANAWSEDKKAADKSITASEIPGSVFNMINFDTRGFLRNQKWEPLTATQNEIDSIGKLLELKGIHVAAVSNTFATEEKFKSMDGSGPRFLHIATHGFYIPLPANKKNEEYRTAGNTIGLQQNPMFRSGLILAGANYSRQNGKTETGAEDGILMAYEIADMDLSKTEIAVLSACETALGDIEGNEGIMGLQRAFKMAGVKKIMMSLWKVPDRETSELMTLFYKNLLSGRSAGDALRSAQLKMKEKYAAFCWGAFVLSE